MLFVDEVALKPPDDKLHLAGKGPFLIVCALSCSFSVLTNGLSELFPLFVAASPPGLHLSTRALGLSLVPVSVGLCIGALLFPALYQTLGCKGVLQSGLCIFLVYTICLPELTRLQTDGPSQWPLWAALLTATLFRGIANTLCFPCLSILLNEAIGDAHAGFYTGIANACTSAGEAAAPLLFGALWGVSVSHPDVAWPCGVHLRVTHEYIFAFKISGNNRIRIQNN